jgi:hypothetical protein
MAAAAPVLNRATLPPGARLGAVAMRELDWLRFGLRDLIRVTLAREELAGVRDWLEAEGFRCRRWRFDLVGAGEKTLDGFSVSGRPAPADAVAGARALLFIARDPARLGDVDAIAEDDWWQGVALGYPPCCVSHYAERAGSFLRGYDDYFRGEEGPFPCWANVLAEPFGHLLISHFPCGPHCAASRAQAEAALAMMLADEPASALATLAGLSRLVFYHRDLGMLSLTGQTLRSRPVLDRAEASGGWRALLEPAAALSLRESGQEALAEWRGGPAGGLIVRRLDFRGSLSC